MIDARREPHGNRSLPPVPASPVLPRTLSSGELLQGRQEIYIQHGGEMYRLRQTRTGKLLLYK